MSKKRNYKKRSVVALVLTGMLAIFGLPVNPEAVTGLTEITCQAIECESE